MFGFVVQPFLITLGLAVLLIVIVHWIAPSLKWKRRWSFPISLLATFILFGTTCNGVMSILDSYRYGTFTYKNLEEIDDGRIRHWMPPMATAITVHKSSSGHLAKFQIEKQQLLTWLSEIRKESEVPEPTDELPPSAESDAFEFAIAFSELGWTYPKDSARYNVTLRSNGAGFTIWFTESLKTAFLRAGYW